MSYDHKKIRDLLGIAGAYETHPLAEFINELCTQLRGASDAIAAAEKKARDSEATANNYAAQLEAATQTIRVMREEREASKAAAVAAPAQKVKRTRVKKAASAEVAS